MQRRDLALVAAGAVSMLLALCSFGQAAAIDQVVGALAPNGGAQLVKSFRLPVGSVVVGLEFVSNDLRTVFPRVALLQGPAERTSEAVIVREVPDVRPVLTHRVHVAFPPITVSGSEELYIAITLPASDGVRAVKDGPGLGATRLSEPNGSYLASPPDGILHPVDVDLAMDLVLQTVGKATPSAPAEATPGGTLLRGRSLSSAASVASIEVALAEDHWICLVVYDVAGKMVRELVRGPFARGQYEWTWDGRDARGQSVGAGVYFVQLRAGAQLLSDKVVVLR